MSAASPVRVRFAPSPTGQLHPGSARTVLFNYLFARQHGGRFLLRIEDTDRARLDEASLASITGGMRWLGLNWDEGPEIGGPHFPYFQSERLSHYHEAVERLLEAGHAYRCFCTAERLRELREAQEAAHQPPGYDRRCLALDAEEVERRFGQEPSVVRLHVPPGTTHVQDMLRGTIDFDNHTIDDQVLLKSDGFPTYHLAATVDDHLMEISHVIRAVEWLPSTPKHVLLYEMLGWEPPLFCHVPQVLGPDRAKLSKRHGAASILEYRDEGYVPEAMVYFLACLGWSPGGTEVDEVLTMEQLVESFDLEKIQLGPAVFDRAKLDSVNGLFIRRLETGDLAARLGPFVPELSAELLHHAAPLVQTRLERLDQAADLLNFLVLRPEPVDLPAELLPRGRATPEAIRVVQEVRAFFEEGEVGPGQEAGLREIGERAGWKPKELFMTIRVALTGSTVTPPLLESAHLLGRAECLVRLDLAIGELIRRAQDA